MDSRKERVLGMLAAVLFAGCAGSALTEAPAFSPSPSMATPSSPGASPVTTVQSETANGGPLGPVVLASGLDAGLWTVGPTGVWTMTRRMDGASPSAIAASIDVVAVASADGIRRFKGPDLVEGSAINLSWPGGEAQSISSFDVAPDGRLALVMGSGTNVAYAVADSAGRVSSIETPRSQPFTPIVAWLGSDRRLVLATDSSQVSRLAVADSTDHVTTLSGLAGCRWFGVSGDGETIAVITESGLYVDGAERFVAGAEPRKAWSIADGTVAWGVALNRDGTRVAFLTGRLAEDGSVTDVREQILTKNAAGWQQTLDSKLTFSNVVGQAWAE